MDPARDPEHPSAPRTTRDGAPSATPCPQGRVLGRGMRPRGALGDGRKPARPPRPSRPLITPTGHSWPQRTAGLRMILFPAIGWLHPRRTVGSAWKTVRLCEKAGWHAGALQGGRVAPGLPPPPYLESPATTPCDPWPWSPAMAHLTGVRTFRQPGQPPAPARAGRRRRRWGAGPRQQLGFLLGWAPEPGGVHQRRTEANNLASRLGRGEKAEPGRHLVCPGQRAPGCARFPPALPGGHGFSLTVLARRGRMVLVT